jgi:polar amino acid transport system permease protein
LAAYVAFSLNITAYLAEIFRAAIQSIDKGQMEASRSLGLSYGQAMRLVIIPQSYRRMIPPVCNEFLMVMKDTSLVCIIAVVELTYQTKMIATSSASSLVYIPTLIIYLILTAIFTYIFNRLEKKFSVYE